MLTCPAVRMSMHRIENAVTGVRGYFLLAVAPGQARLADFWVESEQPADWRALLHLAVGTALKHGKAAELVTISSSVAVSECLAACGFHARARSAVHMLASGKNTLPEQTPRVHMIDDDSAFTNSGRPEFWA